MLKKGKSKKPAAEEKDLQQDNALFENLSKKKRVRRRRLIITIVAIVLVLAVAAFVGVRLLRTRVREKFASGNDEILSYEVSTGSISTVVSGSGSLTDVDLESVTVPDGVEITDVLVEPNDIIAKGDLLASVDMGSVMTTMAELQKEIEDIDEQLSDAEGDEANSKVTAGIGGRVKAVYGEEDAVILDIMCEDGALALLSLDGYMSLPIETDQLSVGDNVTVLCSDEQEYTGSVESVSGGIATILITDDGPAYQDSVTVKNSDGTTIGTGTLDIHNALRVTGYAGTIASVNVAENDSVSASTTLFTLEDTAYSANYTTLLRNRSDLEDTLLSLLTIQRDGAVLSPIDGSVFSVDFDDNTAVATLSHDEKMSVSINVDESDILSLELGQAVTVSVKSVSDDSFEGTLTEIDRTSSSSGTYSAVIELDKTAGMLSGMTASVSVRIEGVDDAILIPIEALHKTSDGAYVYTSYDEELQEYGGKVDVVTGLENSTYIEIKSGLNVGDTVYYTESKSFFGGFSGFGGRSGFSGMPGSGGMPGGSGMPSGGMPDFSGGEKPDFGGEMPSFGGGRSGGGNMPGGRPSGMNFGN